MKTAVLAFTEKGGETAVKVTEILEKSGYSCEGYAYKSVANERLTKFDNLAETAELLFKACGALVFVGACGIAVRAVAPFAKRKDTDPAVIVVDEKHRFCIPILSGHLGGANGLAEEIADELGAVPVITTATDINGKFAVDMFAAHNDLHICSLKTAKLISAAILRGEKIGFYSDIPHGELPEELTGDTKTPLGICVSYSSNDKPFEETLNLVPKNIVIGIGCRKDIDTRAFESSVKGVLAERGVPFDAVESIATIDLKREEPAITVFCDLHNMKAEFFTAGALAAVPGDFSASEFVEAVTGVDNVCERSAVHASGGQLIFRKQIINGVTVAAAAKEYELDLSKGKL